MANVFPRTDWFLDLSAAGVVKRVRFHMGERAEKLLRGRVRAVK
jgi:hypothetical protein